MINYIIIVLLAAVFVVSLAVVITEYFIPKNTGAGRILRAVRIRLREKSLTSFCVTAIVVMVIALVSGDTEKPKMFAALGIMLITLIALHPGYILSIFRQRRKAGKKVRLGFTPILAGEVPEAKLAKVMEPIDTGIDSEEGKE